MKTEVWNAMLDADMNARYWHAILMRYYRRDKVGIIFLAVMTSGTVASWSIWVELELLWKILSAISALLAIALPIINWPKMIKKMAVLRGNWMEIKTQYEILWAKLNQKDHNANEILKVFEEIKKRESDACGEESELPCDKKLLRKCQNEVRQSRGL